MVGAIGWPFEGTSIMLVALLAFFALGFQRGIRREMITLIALGAGWAVSQLVSTQVGERLNRWYKSVRFMAENMVASEPPSVVWERIRALPDPIRNESDLRLLVLVVFVIVAIGAYVWTQRRYMDPLGAMGRVLGGVAGTFNGMVFSTVVVRLAGEPGEQLAPLAWAASPQQGGFSSKAVIIVVVAVLAIAYGLYTASGEGRTD